MRTKAKMILLDVDGTLVDTAPDIADCVDEMMRILEMPPRGEDKVRMWIGNGARRLVKRALIDNMEGEPDAGLYDKAYPIFADLYSKNVCVRSHLFPGVREGLDYLKNLGIKMGCVTNKPARFTEPLLEQLGIRPDFELILSGDTLPKKKPDPLPLQHAAEFFGVAPDESLMVGDSQNDVQAARQAGFQVVCVDYGYNHGRDIHEAAPDAVIHSLAELPSILEQAA